MYAPDVVNELCLYKQLVKFQVLAYRQLTRFELENYLMLYRMSKEWAEIEATVEEREATEKWLRVTIRTFLGRTTRCYRRKALKGRRTGRFD